MENYFMTGAGKGLSGLTRALLGGGTLRSQARDEAYKNAAEVNLLGEKVLSEQLGRRKTGLEADNLEQENRRFKSRPADLLAAASYELGISPTEMGEFRTHLDTGSMPQIQVPTYEGMTGGLDEQDVPTRGENKYNWSPQQRTRMGQQLANVLRTNLGKDVNPHTVAQAGQTMTETGVINEAGDAARSGDDDTVRSLMGSIGKNVLAEKDPRSAFVKTLDAAGIKPGTPQYRMLMTKWLDKQSTHAPATTINMPSAEHYGTDPKTGKPGVFQIGRDGKVQFTPIDPAPPTNPLDAAIADAQKRRKPPAGGGGNAPRPSNAAPAEAPRDPKQRQPNTIYQTPRGPLKWTGTGWVQA